jgi:hypothetical protein
MRLTSRGRYYRSGFLRTLSAEDDRPKWLRKPSKKLKEYWTQEMDKRIIKYLYGKE